MDTGLRKHSEKRVKRLSVVFLFVEMMAVLCLRGKVVKADVIGGRNYDVVIKDCSWSEARLDCQNRGGHLVTIESEDEFYSLVNYLQGNMSYADKTFFIGGRRDPSSSDYYWVDSLNQLTGSALNRSESWASKHWLTNQPSYTDGNLEEFVLSMFSYNGTWGLNDEPDYLISADPSYYPGRIGYICEYDELSYGYQGTDGNPDLYTKTVELAMYGLYTENCGIRSTGLDAYYKVLRNPVSDLSHNGRYSFSELDYTFFFDFDQDGQDEMLVYNIDNWYCYHWKLFDKRDGLVYLISEDCGNKPGNAGHSLSVLADGTISDYSSKGMASYFAEWNGFIFFLDGNIHYLYGYEYRPYSGEPGNELPVVTEMSYALDGEAITGERYRQILDGISADSVDMSGAVQYGIDYRAYIRLAASEGWDSDRDGTLDAQGEIWE